MLEGVSINENGAAYEGGGIFNNQGTLTMTGTFIEGNTTTIVNIGGGGGVFNLNGNFTLVSGSIRNNTVGYYGGGLANVYNSQYSTPTLFVMKGGSIEGNKAIGIPKDDRTGGGGIWSNGPMTLEGGVIKGNTADSGGGVNQWTRVLELKGTTIEGNTALIVGGGMITNNKGTLKVSSGLVSKNTAVESGGGIAVSADSRLEMSGGIVSENSSRDGAGLKT